MRANLTYYVLPGRPGALVACRHPNRVLLGMLAGGWQVIMHEVWANRAGNNDEWKT